jgi:hypothetical protein
VAPRPVEGRFSIEEQMAGIDTLLKKTQFIRDDEEDLFE